MDKKRNDFKKIAQSLGIIIPASLLIVGNVNATPTKITQPCNNQLVKQLISKKSSNEVINRISLFVKISENNDDFVLHTNNHTNSESNHTNTHSNSYHSDYHTNVEGYSDERSCVVHNNTHSNTPGESSHTDYTSEHTNQHTDNPDC
ncbi:MAG: hypothetical protein LBE91_20520 [Tannerella sp.]|jgi:hypothetical protein|nr:hypothetical protein [Tannerella sp.]